MIRLFALFVAIVGLTSCEKTVKKEPVLNEKPVLVESEPLPNEMWRGVCFAHSWEKMGIYGYGTDSGMEALKHLKAQGINYVSLTPFGFMPDTEASEIKGSHNSSFQFGETDGRIEDGTRQAQSLGMRVMLKPHIWIRGGEWRGRIVPKKGGKVVWDEWWDSHDAWILHYAKLAERLKIDSFVIGLELHTAVGNRPDRLISLAGKVREVYKGHITYSANWNEPVPLKVWKAMDSVGVQFYPPLVKKGEEETDTVIRKNLNEHLDHWVDMATRSNKPIVITEYGFRSAVGAAKYPNAWPDRNPNEVPDNELQARLYKIFFEEFSKRDEVAGLFLWKYFTNKDTDEEGPNGFSPRGKPAESVIRAFSEISK